MLGLVHEDVGCSLGAERAGSPVMTLARAPAVAALAARQLECAAQCDFTARSSTTGTRPRVLEEAGC